MENDVRDITLTSTTETPEEMSEALGVPAEGDPNAAGVVATNAGTPAKGTTATATDDEGGDGEADAVVVKPDAAKATTKVPADTRTETERLIDRMKFENAQAIRDANALREENARLKAQPATATTTPAAVIIKPEPVAYAVPKPKIDAFDTVEAWTEAVADWSIAKVRHDIREESRVEREVEAAQRNTETQSQLQTRHDARIAEFKATHPDFDEVREQAIAQDLPFNEMMLAHIQSSEHGTELAYALAKNPAECRRIAALKQGPTLVALGAFETKHAIGTSTATATTTEATKPAPKVPAKPVKPAVEVAEEPIAPLGAGPTRTLKSVETMTQHEYNEWRRAGGGKR